MQRDRPRRQPEINANGTALRSGARKGASDRIRSGMKDSHTRLASAQKRRSPHGKTGRKMGCWGDAASAWQRLRRLSAARLVWQGSTQSWGVCDYLACGRLADGQQLGKSTGLLLIKTWRIVDQRPRNYQWFRKNMPRFTLTFQSLSPAPSCAAVPAAGSAHAYR